jgi:hypothetical protein
VQFSNSHININNASITRVRLAQIDRRVEIEAAPQHSIHTNFDFMADFFVIETTNESGVVKQESVSVNLTNLSVGHRGLVRIDGLERATMLRKLGVH